MLFIRENAKSSKKIIQMKKKKKKNAKMLMKIGNLRIQLKVKVMALYFISVLKTNFIQKHY